MCSRSANSNRIGARFGQKNFVRSTGSTVAACSATQFPSRLGRSRERVIHTRPRFVGRSSRASPRTGGVSRGTGGPQRVRQRRAGCFERCIAELAKWFGRQVSRARQAIASPPVPRSSFLAKRRLSMPGARCWKQCLCWSVARELTGSAEVPMHPVAPPAPIHVPPSVLSDLLQECCQHLDQEVFLQRIPMLKSCPRFSRSPLRISFGVALRERCRAKLNRDPVAKLRAWKSRTHSHCVAPPTQARRRGRSGRVGPVGR